jgi:hypothetical protein
MTVVLSLLKHKARSAVRLLFILLVCPLDEDEIIVQINYNFNTGCKHPWSSTFPPTKKPLKEERVSILPLRLECISTVTIGTGRAEILIRLFRCSKAEAATDSVDIKNT